MISFTYTIFRGLQAKIRDIFREEEEAPYPLRSDSKKGLSDAHLKLSEYYYKFNESPFYLWASRTSHLA